jgi:hypothetical protein
MTKIKTLLASAAAIAFLFSAPAAQAHCDTVDGPVATAGQAALESGNINLALVYAPAAAEAELKAAFGQSLKVRGLGAEAKTLADRAFIETLVRLHRAGEGAPYAGLKPAGLDFGPAIPAAERALADGKLQEVRAVLVKELEHALHERFDRVRETPAIEPKTADDVAVARKRVSAELGFVTFVEGLREAMAGEGKPAHEH